MDLTDLRNIKILLSGSQTRPLKRLGQNFLIDKSVLDKIVEAADLKQDDLVLEVGPGLGVLTQELAKRVNQVIAVEKDPNLVKILNEELKKESIKNVELIQGDILKSQILNPNDQRKVALQPRCFTQSNPNLKNPKKNRVDSCKPEIGHWSLGFGHYKVAANLPYYITSPVIRKFLESPNPPELMVLMVQKEVAQRICAKPPQMNLLAVSVQFYGAPEIISYIPKTCFWPQPKVDSAIIKIIPFVKAMYPAPEKFFKLIKAGFSQPRKQLANNLSKGLKLDKQQAIKALLKNNIQPSQRAQTLSLHNWLNLAESF